MIASTNFIGTQAIGGAGGAGAPAADVGGAGGEGGTVYGGVFYGDDDYTMIADTTFTSGLAQGGAGGVGGTPSSTGLGGAGGEGGYVEGSILDYSDNISLLNVTVGGSALDGNTAVGGSGGVGGAGYGVAYDGGAGGAGGYVEGALLENYDLSLANTVISYGTAIGGNGGAGGAAGTGSGVGGDGGEGGGIYSAGIYDYEAYTAGGVSIIDNTATGGNGGDAGGVGGAGGGSRTTGGDGGVVVGAGYLGSDQDTLLANSTISGNTGTGGTGGSATSSGFTGGGAGGFVEGGGVYNYDGGHLGLALVTVSGNSITGGAGGNTNGANVLGAPGLGGAALGGGIANDDGSTLGVTGSTVNDNTAVGGAGGSGYIAASPGASYGGGLYNHANTFVKDSTFTGNSADYGGGLANNSASLLDLSFSNLNYNTANIADPSVVNRGTFIDSFNTYTVASPIIVTAPGTQSSTAGLSHTYSLGSFTDPNPASSWTEVINWGDSTSSTLTLPPGSLGTLDHTYATASAYTVTVSITDNLDGTGSNSFTANVAAVAPVVVTSPATQASTVGVAHTFNLGSFTDPNPASSWTENINWGDSSSSTLTLPPGSLGTLSHIYATTGAFTPTVSVIDNLGGTGSNSFTANVTAVSPIVVTSPGNQSSTAGVSKLFNLGSFTDPNPASSWTENINWGDNSSSTLTLPPGSLGTLSHIYASAGAYTVSVAVTDNVTGTGSTSFVSNVSAALLPISVTSPGSQSAVAGFAQSISLGSFTDPNAASSWTENINWGDSTSSTLTLPPGSLGNLNHTYASAGSFPVTVTVTDNLTATSSNSFTASVAATVSPITVASPGTQSSAAGVSQAFSLGSFTDPNPGTSWTEMIKWGDNTTSTLNLPPGSLGDLSHTYASAGTYTISVTVADNLLASGFNTFAANVAGSVSPLSVVAAPTQSATAGTAQWFSLGSFTDPNTTATSWTEMINWGDSTTSTLNLPPGLIGILSHTYASAGNYTATVSVTDNLGGTGSSAFTANVGSAPVGGIALYSVPITKPANSNSSMVVAKFTDSNTSLSSSAYAATVLWSDGKTTRGIVTGAAGHFKVSSKHPMGHRISNNGEIARVIVWHKSNPSAKNSVTNFTTITSPTSVPATRAHLANVHDLALSQVSVKKTRGSM